MSKMIKNLISHIEAPSTTMKCPMDLKMRRDLPQDISNRELTKFAASDTFIRTSGSAPMDPSELKKSINPPKIDYSFRIPGRNLEGHRGHQTATTDECVLLQLPGSVCKCLGGGYRPSQKHLRPISDHLKCISDLLKCISDHLKSISIASQIIGDWSSFNVCGRNGCTANASQALTNTFR